jgi:hypothetical protein
MRKVDKIKKINFEDPAFSLKECPDYIADRVSYIIFGFISYKSQNWWLPGAEEGCVGSLANAISNIGEEYVIKYESWSRKNTQNTNNKIYSINGKEIIDLGYCFPISWLWEDFEEEYLERVDNYKKQVSLKKQQLKIKAAEKTKEQAKLVSSIVGKLTEKEIKLCLRKDFKQIINKHSSRKKADE